MEGREGGRPASPAGPVLPSGCCWWWCGISPASDSGRSDMAEEMTLMACPPARLSGTERPVGKDVRSLLEVMMGIARYCAIGCAECICGRNGAL